MAETTDASENARSHLQQLIERAERLEGEIAGLNDDKRDLFAEAKSAGFDVKVMKDCLRIRRKEPSALAEHNAVLALYLSTLGMADAADDVEQIQGSVQAHPRSTSDANSGALDWSLVRRPQTQAA
ncbi:DUF2312 domain-containing protein [Methylobacterium sp. Leaf399]|uniref:DUF2312 domain-containing protein n=1 Tax=Methylobacterium sp. Leaf399 TaxID=1736364 RepID=UPI0009EBCCDC|nr:DUF2312 domain-containing protein [Methylobacterium sp. Leaf399]